MLFRSIMNKFEDLERLQYLRQNNAITEQEFEEEKKKILNSTLSENTNRESKKVKPKMKPSQIILVIILTIVFIAVARIYNIWAYSWI